MGHAPCSSLLRNTAGTDWVCHPPWSSSPFQQSRFSPAIPDEWIIPSFFFFHFPPYAQLLFFYFFFSSLHLSMSVNSLFQTLGPLPMLIVLSSFSWRWAMYFCANLSYNGSKHKHSFEALASLLTSSLPASLKYFMTTLLFTRELFMIHSYLHLTYTLNLPPMAWIFFKCCVYKSGLRYSSFTCMSVTKCPCHLLTGWLAREVELCSPKKGERLWALWCSKVLC